MPRELAEQMIGLDNEEQIFFKCPRNMEITERGIDALEKEGYKFKSMKGVGQGDKPSPLLLGSCDGHATQCTQENSKQF